MKNRALFFLFSFMMVLPATTNAQLGGMLKNKMNKVVNAGAKTAVKEVDNKVDSAAIKEAEKAQEKGDARTEAKKIIPLLQGFIWLLRPTTRKML
jgi:DNA topoisomerase VI subunit B